MDLHQTDPTELASEVARLEDRIRRLERDLKLPLEPDLSEQAGQLSNRIMLMRLLEIERQNLVRVRHELERRKSA
jgi:hypothetical protein